MLGFRGMLNADVLSFQEFMTREPLPLSTIHNAVLEFIRGRKDVVLFGAHAVNAYTPEPRMTQDVDLFSTRAKELVEELRNHLSRKFHIAVRLREVAQGRGFRLFQVRKGGNRHLVDVRPVAELPASKRVASVRVLAPAELIASKVLAYHGRRGQPKSGTDWRDIAALLLAFPDLKQASGPVANALGAMDADHGALLQWRCLVNEKIRPEDPDKEF